MAKRITPITVFCQTPEQAIQKARADNSGAALTSGPGTIKFHALIAQHGAGEFKTLYVPLVLKGKFAPPVGGIVREI